MLDQLTRRIEFLEKWQRKLTTLTQRSEITGGFPRIAFADLPTPNLTGGRVFYCTNCRKSGEGAGLGTGVYIGETNVSSVAQWVRLDDQTSAGIAAV